MRLKDKIAIVTGGARGIGKTICAEFLKEGGKVVIFDVNGDAGKKTAAEFNKEHGSGSAVFYMVDITNEENVEETINTVVQEYGRVDILVNNAGITLDNLILRMKVKDWKKVIDINLTGAFICSKFAVKHMVRARSGKIINMASIVGVHGNAGQANYSASKAGLIGLTKTLARELAGRNILVNAVAPGYIETDMTGKLPDKVREMLLGQIPTGKLGSVDDVAKAVLFLASKDSDYITGTVLGVDGGMGI
ncbi:MAG: 3-oxoacyl-[acyl-carrier-protein] reductase [Actinomycetia bacterium]|nr:3-oxoacyl-[acyl-carrier-protein] reductase [Actinomycetes bacterium]